MQIVSLGDNLHEVSDPVFWKTDSAESACTMVLTL